MIPATCSPRFSSTAVPWSHRAHPGAQAACRPWYCDPRDRHHCLRGRPRQRQGVPGGIQRVREETDRPHSVLRGRREPRGRPQPCPVDLRGATAPAGRLDRAHRLGRDERRRKIALVAGQMNGEVETRNGDRGVVRQDRRVAKVTPPVRHVPITLSAARSKFRAADWTDRIGRRARRPH
jgi:hypothetical protein